MDKKISELDPYAPVAGMTGNELFAIAVDVGTAPAVDMQNFRVLGSQLAGSNNTGIKTLSTAGGSPGFVSEFKSSDPTYPYISENADFTITALSPTIIRVSATGPVIFTDADNYFNPVVPIVTEFPQFDIDVTAIPNVPIGTHTYYIYIKKD